MNLSAAQLARLLHLRRRFYERLRREFEMRFPLQYRGPLKASKEGGSGRVAEKNRLRWYFHEQLERLLMQGDFSRLPLRKKLTTQTQGGIVVDFSGIPDIEFNGISFVPVIDRNMRVACELDIRMDRPDVFDSVLHDGDIDNRIKTLFDALRCPRAASEVAGNENNPNATYCVCLFEDDSMITAFKADSRPSLLGLQKGEVILSIDVSIRAHDLVFDAEEP